MKKIILSLLVFVSLSVKSQTYVDSLNQKTSVSLQVRDWLYLNSFLANNEEFENVYDSMKIKLRVAVAPTLTTVIAVSDIKNGQVLSLAKILKQGAYGVVVFPYTRIDNALKAANAFTLLYINAMDAEYTTKYNNRVQFELDRLRAVL